MLDGRQEGLWVVEKTAAAAAAALATRGRRFAAVLVLSTSFRRISLQGGVFHGEVDRGCSFGAASALVGAELLGCFGLGWVGLN